jgi:membrane protein DedA with SNARE-associated domain
VLRLELAAKEHVNGVGELGLSIVAHRTGPCRQRIGALSWLAAATTNGASVGTMKLRASSISVYLGLSIPDKPATVPAAALCKRENGIVSTIMIAAVAAAAAVLLRWCYWYTSGRSAGIGLVSCSTSLQQHDTQNVQSCMIWR